MRNKLFAVAFAVAVFGIGEIASAAVTKAWYDPATGNVTIRDIEAGKLIGGIQVKGANLDIDPAPDALGGFVDTSISGEISWLFFTPKTADTNLGNVFPTGLTKSALDSGYFAGLVVQGSGNPDPVGVPFAVPEPASIAMAGLAMIGCLAARRRVNG